jgi:hypothetical protein
VEGPAVTGTDLDNALLYNIGGRADAATRYGAALERRVDLDQPHFSVLWIGHEIDLFEGRLVRAVRCRQSPSTVRAFKIKNQKIINHN